MLIVNAQRTKLTELSWLLDVSESCQPITELRPIGVRYGTVHSGPAVPHPERHPYCEFGTTLQGEVVEFVEREQAKRLPGDLFLAGPGVPHWAQITQYPHQFITIYFLPSVLIEQGPEQDGARMLRRFTAPQALKERLVRPPTDLQQLLLRGFEEIAMEFEHPRFGTEMRLRTILVEMLVRLLRWEQEQVKEVPEGEANVDWQNLSRAMHYLRTHFTESVYARDVASAAGVCQSRLKVMFREALGISWVHFLQGYRVERAAALLNDPRYRVIEAAMAVGFESLSHFNATFRTFMGVSPTTYVKRVRKQGARKETADTLAGTSAADKSQK
ncbi:MAG: AraC family transcriptional regulator [Candidatus Omnitrophica bacterium]|nr:AraC family transcriptional regulator [Candidatus Omnitrophota bacterium]